MMLKARMSSALLGMMGFLAVLAGCVVEPTDEEVTAATYESVAENECVFQSMDPDVVQFTEADDPGDFEPFASVTFTRTCIGWAFAVNRANNSVVAAYADRCRRANGTWTGVRRWQGECFGDVANCNGNIQCGPCC